MTLCECQRKAANCEVFDGKRWQPHCRLCAEEAMDCEQGALIRGLGYAAEGADRR